MAFAFHNNGFSQNCKASKGLKRAPRRTAPPANQVRIMVLAGTTGSKLVAVGPGGGTVTLADNLT
jgi:hypothetical protein